MARLLAHLHDMLSQTIPLKILSGLVSEDPLIPGIYSSSTGIVCVTINPEDQTAAQAIIDAFDWSDGAAQASQVLALRTQADQSLTSGMDRYDKLIRALLEVTVRGLNDVFAACPRLISSITRSGTTATVTTPTAHGLTDGRNVIVVGCDAAAYNGQKTITVTSATTFTYGGVSGTPASPAAGSPLYTLSARSLPEALSRTDVMTQMRGIIAAGDVD